MGMQLITTCVGVDRRDLTHLHNCIDKALDVTYRTFRKNVGPVAVDEIAAQLGYGKDLHIKNDWAVRFCRSKWKGKRCYYIRWSGIEHIFQ